MPVDLSPDTRRKLVGVLGMLGSDHAGERDAAAQLANRIVRGAGLTWVELIAVPRLEARPDSSPRRPPIGWRERAARCAEYPLWLSEWEQNFLGGLPRRAQPSEKQLAALDRIALKLRSQGVAV
jgi:hypothetical protein